jgi:DnaD/phage-associated family protein
MARGRMINNAISRDKDIADLSSDSCRLFFTWWISHADKNGRVYADPDVAKSTVVPRLKHITAEDIAGYIKEIEEKEFIIVYEVDGDIYAEFIEFEKNQIGLRKDREPDSEIPAPPIRQTSGNHPEDIRTKLKEVKLKEDKHGAAVYSAYQNNIGLLSGVISEKLDADIVEYTAAWVIDAIEESTRQEKRSLAYIEGILKRWKRDGKGTDKPTGNKRTIKIDGGTMEVGMA